MYSLLYFLYFYFFYHYKKNNNKLYLFLASCSSWLCRWYFNGILVKIFQHRRAKRYGVTAVKRRKKVIASLTSYPARIDTAWIAVETILRQSVKADEVILWLAKSQFKKGLTSLPKELIAQIKRGLTIRFCEDLRSHKKYYYTMKEHPEDIVIVFDDDMFYPKNMIMNLLKLNKKVPNNIICSSSSRFHKDNILSPIIWEPAFEKTSDEQCLGINSGSGTLFPPHSLHSNVFDKAKMKELTLQSDDLWLTAAAYMQGTRFTTLRYQPFPVTITGSQKESLYYSNNFETSEINNNTQWRAILQCYWKELSGWLKQFGIMDIADISMGITENSKKIADKTLENIHKSIQADPVNNTPALSIIIPVYNLETYIRQCLESLAGYEGLSLEILLIDDGSTDNSPLICDEYAAEYPFIQVIHKKNEGAAKARNTGIRYATGKYVMFVDGDDFLAEGILSHIINKLNGATELFTFHFYDYYEAEDKQYKVTHITMSSLYDKNGDITKDVFYSVPALPMPWLYILKRDFIYQNDLFMKTGILDEDEEWSARVFANLKIAKVLDLYAYNYRRNRAASLTFQRSLANLYADLDIIEGLKAEADKDKYDKRQKHILHNKCRELMIKIASDTAAQTPEHRAVISRRLKNCRSLLLGGSGAEIGMYLLSLVLGWDKANKLLKKAVSFKALWKR
ncbi:MAG TPA: glycosyltransferase [Mobilitalea sp.]|nr:glycosyltransferase [Mobilitalea sp.]